MARGWSQIRPELEPFAENLGHPGAQARIVEAVRAGSFVPLEFAQLEVFHPTLDVRGWIDVAVGALQIGRPGDAVRPMVSHASEQQIADLLGVYVPTPDVLDRLHEASPVHAEPLTGPVSATLGAMEEHHGELADLAAAGAWDNAKGWVNHPRLARPGGEKFGKKTAINYAWHTTGAPQPPGTPGPKPSVSSPEFRVLQQPGGAHNVNHTDRSQLAVGFVHPTMILEQAGVPVTVDVAQVAIDPVLHPMLSRSGPVLMRHPWIAPCLPLSEGGSCPGGAPLPPPPAGGSAAGPVAKAVGPLKRVVPVGLAGAALYAAIRWL